MRRVIRGHYDKEMDRRKFLEHRVVHKPPKGQEKRDWNICAYVSCLVGPVQWGRSKRSKLKWCLQKSELQVSKYRNKMQVTAVKAWLWREGEKLGGGIIHWSHSAISQTTGKEWGSSEVSLGALT